ncbi:MAG: MATE family efflux transporter [Myxococcales bacterium]|nr:MATE family efflux transporter [Myxococcales bacterium]
MTGGSLPWGLLRFGTPLVVGMVLHTSFNLVDMFMISRVPGRGVATAALAALGLCDMVTAVATILSNGISTAAVAVISRQVGAGDRERVGRAVYTSLWLVGGLSVAFGLVGVFGSDFIVHDVMYAKGQVADLAVPYLRVMLGGCFSIFFLLQLTAVLRALGHAKSAAALLVGGNVVNLFLNVVFIYGTGPAPELLAWGRPVAAALGVPAMGLSGAAWATLIARTVPVLVGLAVLAWGLTGTRLRWVYLRPDGRVLGALIRIGWPSSAQLVLRVGLALFIVALVSAEYTTAADPSALAAYSICLRLETMALFIGMGWGAAASAYVGANLGAGRRRRALHAGWVCAAYNFVAMVALALLYLAFARQLVGFFDPRPEVVAIGREYLDAVALSYALLGIGLVLSQAMTGAGATLSSLVLDAVVVLAVVAPLAYAVAVWLDADRVWLWRVLAGGNALAALAYVAYYSRGRFLDKAV